MLNFKDKKIILASASPRRKELLQGLDLDFTVDTRNNFEEDNSLKLSAKELTLYLAKGKSYGFWRDLEEDEILITADTLVWENDRVIAKPKDKEDARAMLQSLMGKEHWVSTAVVIRSKSQEIAFEDSCKVVFEALSPEEINYYIDTYKPYDKAGAYGVQEWLGYVATSRLEGSVYTVIGMPIHLVYKNLKKFL